MYSTENGCATTIQIRKGAASVQHQDSAQKSFSLQISFDDFQALFESERESIKKQRLEKSYSSCGNERLLESSPLEIVASPPPLEESTEVVLRYKRPFSLQRAEQKHSVDSQLPVLHIGRGPGDGVSPVEHGKCGNNPHVLDFEEIP